MSDNHLDDGLDELERELLRLVRQAQLPGQEPISHWIVDRHRHPQAAGLGSRVPDV
jgi:hypothetical protein